GAHRRNAVLKPAERPANGRRQALVDIAGHLADLHQDALHRPERLRDVLGGLEGEILTELLPRLARGGEQPRPALRGARAAAGDQPDRGHPAPQPHAPAPAAPGTRDGQDRAPLAQRKRTETNEHRDSPDDGARPELAPHARCAAWAARTRAVI